MLLLKFAIGWPLLWAGIIVIVVGVYLCVRDRIPKNIEPWFPRAANVIAVLYVMFMLTQHWMPLGPQLGFVRNLSFTATSPPQTRARPGDPQRFLLERQRLPT